MIGFTEITAGALLATELSKGIRAIKDIANDGKEIYNTSKDLPLFTKNINSKEVSNFNEADRSLYLNESSNNNENTLDNKANDIKDMNEANKILKENNEDTRKEINEQSPYSDEINKYIKSIEELNIYKEIGLKEMEINGRLCLCRDIDLDYVDPKTGLINKELMEKGRSPIDKSTGEKIELHHIGQEYDSPLAELTSDSEHGDKYSKLHQNESESWRNDSILKNKYNNSDKPNHWKDRIRGDI